MTEFKVIDRADASFPIRGNKIQPITQAILDTAETGQVVELMAKARTRYLNANAYVKRHNLPLRVRSANNWRYVWCEKTGKR